MPITFGRIANGFAEPKSKSDNQQSPKSLPFRLTMLNGSCGDLQVTDGDLISEGNRALARIMLCDVPIW
jgi:hypothetical protein